MLRERQQTRQETSQWLETRDSPLNGRRWPTRSPQRATRVSAQCSHDREHFDDAVAQLEKHGDAARAVHAYVIRELLETSFQDGVSGDDVSDVLTRTVDTAAQWDVSVPPDSVVAVLIGALGVSERRDDDAAAAAIPLAAIIGAAMLVAAEMATDAAVDHVPYLVRAVDEIHRAQTLEIP